MVLISAKQSWSFPMSLSTRRAEKTVRSRTFAGGTLVVIPAELSVDILEQSAYLAEHRVDWVPAIRKHVEER